MSSYNSSALFKDYAISERGFIITFSKEDSWINLERKTSAVGKSSKYMMPCNITTYRFVSASNDLEFLSECDTSEILLLGEYWEVRMRGQQARKRSKFLDKLREVGVYSD